MATGLIGFFVTVEKEGWEEAVFISIAIFAIVLIWEEIDALWKK